MSETIRINKTDMTFNKIWYVDPVNGNDTTGDGSSANPYASITQVLTLASITTNADAIYCKAGTYSATSYNMHNTAPNNIIGDCSATRFDAGTNLITFTFPSNITTNKTFKMYRLYVKHLIIAANSTAYTAVYNEMYNCVFDSVNGNYGLNISESHYMGNSQTLLKLYNSVFTTGTALNLNIGDTMYSEDVSTYIYNSVSYSSVHTDNGGTYASIRTPSLVTGLPNTTTYDANYNLTSGTWRDAGTGTDPDDTTANIGVYGGTYGWGIWYDYRYLVKDGTDIKTFKNGTWQTVGVADTDLTEDKFNTQTSVLTTVPATLTSNVAWDSTMQYTGVDYSTGYSYISYTNNVLKEYDENLVLKNTWTLPGMVRYYPCSLTYDGVRYLCATNGTALYIVNTSTGAINSYTITGNVGDVVGTKGNILYITTQPGAVATFDITTRTFTVLGTPPSKAISIGACYKGFYHNDDYIVYPYSVNGSSPGVYGIGVYSISKNTYTLMYEDTGSASVYFDDSFFYVLCWQYQATNIYFKKYSMDTLALVLNVYNTTKATPLNTSTVKGRMPYLPGNYVYGMDGTSVQVLNFYDKTTGLYSRSLTMPWTGYGTFQIGGVIPFKDSDGWKMCVRGLYSCYSIISVAAIPAVLGTYAFASTASCMSTTSDTLYITGTATSPALAMLKFSTPKYFNPSQVPTNEWKQLSNPQLLMWTTDPAPTKSVAMTASPNTQVIKETIDHTLSTMGISLTATGSVGVLISGDSGTTWYGFDGTNMVTVDTANSSDVTSKMITVAKSASITYAMLKAIAPTTSRFAVVLNQDIPSTTTNADLLVVMVDNAVQTKIQINGTDKTALNAAHTAGAVEQQTLHYTDFTDGSNTVTAYAIDQGGDSATVATTVKREPSHRLTVDRDFTVLDGGYTWNGGVFNGTTTGNGNLVTTDTTAVDLHGYSGITSINITGSGGKYLLSFDGRQTWKTAVLTGWVPGTHNSVPVMVTDTAPSGIASANSESNGMAYKVFDGSVGPWGSDGITGWVAYEFLKPCRVSKYVMDMTSYGGYGPKAWTIQGFDGLAWTVLDTQTNITDWSSIREFSIASPNLYRKYKINVTQCNSASILYIQELQLWADSPVYGWQDTTLDQISSIGMTPDTINALVSSDYAPVFQRQQLDFAAFLDASNAVTAAPNAVETLDYTDTIGNSWTNGLKTILNYTPVTGKIITKAGMRNMNGGYANMYFYSGDTLVNTLHETVQGYLTYYTVPAGTTITRIQVDSSGDGVAYSSNTAIEIYVKDMASYLDAINVVLPDMQPPVIASDSMTPSSMHYHNVELKATITDVDGDNVSYSILINGTQYVAPTAAVQGPINVDLVIPYSSFNVGTNTVRLNATCPSKSAYKDYTVELIETPPVATITQHDFKGFKASIGDAENDTISYKLTLTNVTDGTSVDLVSQTTPQASPVTVDVDPGILQYKKNYKYTLEYHDPYGQSGSVEYNFAGGIKGLAFYDATTDSYWSDVAGTALMILDFGLFNAGTKSAIKSITLVNNTGSTLTNIKLDSTNPYTGSKVMFSLYSDMSLSAESLDLGSYTMNDGDTKLIYLQMSADYDAKDAGSNVIISGTGTVG